MLIRLLLFCCLGLIPMSIFSQRAQSAVDFKQVDARITIDTLSGTLEVQADYLMDAREKSASFYLDAHNLNIAKLRINGRRAKYKNEGGRLTIYKKLKTDKSYSIELDYSVKPTQTVYFVGWGDSDPMNNQVWTQGQGKYTSHWLPSLDDMNDKLVFKLEIGFAPGYTVLANGKLIQTRIENGLKYWSYAMEDPMSSYLAAFAIGKYDVEDQMSSSGIPLYNYYYSGARQRAEPTYRYTREMFDFLEKEIGLAYPWQDYKQVPVMDFHYAGMENTGLTIYSDDYLIDSLAFTDQNYVEVNAHEMAHQWFGNLVTERDGTHHWLHEGFATYYALLAAREVLGEEAYYWKLYDKALALKKQADEGRGEALTDPGASSLTFYDKGAWALVILREILGDPSFRTGIKKFLQRYRFQNATIPDLVKEMESASGKDLTAFQRDWLSGKSFPYQDALTYLSANSGAVGELLDLQHEVRTSALPNADILRKHWAQCSSSEVKRRSLSAYFKSLPHDFIKEAFDTGDIGIRQAIAVSTTSIPVELKSEYESLLSDASYLTQELALYLLWVHFPEDRVRYLEQLKGTIGFQSRNVEQLWLLLASLTPQYESKENRTRYKQQLSGYTAAKYSLRVRERAFGLLTEIQWMEDQNVQDLIQAAGHHNYAFRSFARDLLEFYLKSPEQKERIRDLIKELKPEERRYIDKKLTEE